MHNLQPHRGLTSDRKWSKSGDDDFAGDMDSPINEGRRFSQATIVTQQPSEHVPHSLCTSGVQSQHRRALPDCILDQDLNPTMLSDSQRRHTFSNSLQTPQGRLDLASLHNITNGNGVLPISRNTSPPLPSRQLPAYIKPLPARIGVDEVTYLSKKGALSIPSVPFRNALLQCFIEFVHPYMPIVDIQEIVATIDRNDGRDQLSLLGFQAIMFSGVATVDMKYIKGAGYMTRREARRDFFQKTRVRIPNLFMTEQTTNEISAFVRL